MKGKCYPALADILPKRDATVPTQYPYAELTWPGKSEGKPIPPVIWFDRMPRAV